jgi:hypothetical protein
MSRVAEVLILATVLAVCMPDIVGDHLPRLPATCPRQPVACPLGRCPLAPASSSPHGDTGARADLAAPV